MGGRTFPMKGACFKSWRSSHAMQATIGVWSPTMLEVKLHSVSSSLLVSMYTVDGCVL